MGTGSAAAAAASASSGLDSATFGVEEEARAAISMRLRSILSQHGMQYC